MIKIYILTVLFVAAQAANFTVHDKGTNNTCLLLQLEGTVDLTDSTANKTTVSLKFENATLIDSSNCTHIKLNLTKSVVVGFQFDAISNEWAVTPFTQFEPHAVFGDKSNSTDVVDYSANPLEANFKKNESYQCLATTELFFNKSKLEFNITVTANTTDFRIQANNHTNFVDGEVCKADKHVTTLAPTTRAPTTRAPTTPQPSYNQDFSCKVGNTTQFRVIGSFALVITYNTTDGKTKTVSLDVPQVQPANETDCSSKFNETLIFEFFQDWRIEYIFSVETPKSPLLGASQKYYVSNITVTYVYDNHLPNSSTNGSVTVHSSKEKYLEASTNGYYICRNLKLAIDQHVTLITKDFKYKAFNSQGDINFNSGNVSECPGDEDTSSVVPIAVGAALAGLVVIVLIAYLIGRRRSRKAGYESV